MTSTLHMRLLSVIVVLTIGSLIACSHQTTSPEQQREEMIRTQIIQRGINDEQILRAFREVPREQYVLPKFKDHAYDDNETPIGYEQTLDRPYENALMIKALNLKPSDRVLEVGTGSGYLSSLLSRIVTEVYSIDLDPRFVREASERTLRLGYQNVHIKQADGFLGWPEHAPFNAMIMTCSPDAIPKPLIEQLAEGGHIVLPIGGEQRFQELVLFQKRDGKLTEEARLLPAEFVPMQGIIKQKP